MPQINPQRVLSDLRTLATFGAYKTGVHRPTLSKEDIAAREWFVARMREAGLDASIDGVANIFGKSPAPGRKALSGSHLESQNHAGWLDGPLGCVYALEAARAIAEDPATRNLGVDVVVFCDEEGHFGSFLGSRSYIGALEESEIDAASNRATGLSMRAGLEAAGWSDRPRHLIDTSRYAAFFEAHIEQGDTLESAGLKIGVVTAIVAIWQYKFTVQGEQNHAGTTSMARRRDAGRELVRLLAALDARFPDICGPRTVWTTGRIELDPGEKSIIRARPRPCFSCATQTPPCSIGWRRRSTRLSSAPTGPAAASWRSSASAPARPPSWTRACRRRWTVPPRPTRRASTCACPRAPATTRSGWRASCRRP